MWEKDWNVFAQAVSERLRTGATAAALAAEFDTREITWTGVLLEKSIDDLSPAVTIAVPDTVIDVGNRRSVHIDRLTVPSTWEAAQTWQGIPIGATVSFTAALGDSAVFPAVEVETLPTGRVLLMIRLSEGRPVLH